MNNSKIVKVEITYPSFIDDIKEVVDISVPCNLTEQEENLYIQNIIDNDYAFLYGY